MSKKNLYLAATVSCLTGALFGYSVGFIGGVLVLPSFLRHFHLDNVPRPDAAAAQATTVTAWLIGALLGVPLGVPICSKLGRKNCLTFSALLYTIGAVLQILSLSGSANLGIFDIGRLLNGLGVGAGTLVSPMYISEISPSVDRGMLMSGYQTIIQFSALIGFWGAFASNSLFPSSSDLQWQIPVGIQLVPGVLLLLSTLVVPETPRFLAERGRLDEAKRALVWLRMKPEQSQEVEQELSDIFEVVNENEAMKELGKQSFLNEIKKPHVRKRLHVGVGLMIAQNMVGLNALNYYAPVIFMSAGFTSVSSSLFLTGLFGVVKLVSACAFMFVFVKVRGNLFWLKLGSLMCGMSMFVLAYFVKEMSLPDGKHESSITIGGVISVLMVYVFAFFFGVSLGPISWNVCSEIFPLQINAKCCAITTCTQWLFQIVIASMTPRLLASIGWATYLIYGIFCMASFVWVIWIVPETRGVALGRPMDSLFIKSNDTGLQLSDDSGLEVTETTGLLEGEQRRTSIVAYT